MQAGGGAGATSPVRDAEAPPRGMFNMQINNLKVEVEGDTAIAELFWSSVVSETLISPSSVTEYGREQTEFAKQNNRWLIKHRVVTSGGGMPESLLKSYMAR